MVLPHVLEVIVGIVTVMHLHPQHARSNNADNNGVETNAAGCYMGQAWLQDWLSVACETMERCIFIPDTDSSL